MLAAILCSLSVFSQSNVIIPLGDNILAENSFSFARQAFRNQYMPLTMQSNTRGIFMEGRGGVSLMATIEANANGTIKEISFICGSMYNIDLKKELMDAGYSLIKSGKTTLGNGAIVPQKIYSKGIRRCYVMTLDEDFLHIIFKFR